MRAVQYVIDHVIESERGGTWLVCLDGRILARFAVRDAAVAAARQLATLDCVSGNRAEVHLLGSGSKAERVFLCDGTSEPIERAPAQP